ncbi:MAG: AzlC family ABC transporter permease, partial [Methyloligellaceae bacterium]
MNKPESSNRSGFVLGLRDSLGIPVVGITSALVGYGVMAREAGLDVTLTLMSVLTIWAMPVLMGFVELVAAGSSPLVVLITLLAVGFRNLPMALSAMPMIRAKPGFRWIQIFFAQILSPTSWVQITVVGRKLQPAHRMPYYLAFSLALLAFGMLGTWIGFALTENLPSAIGLSLLLLPP